MNVISEFGSSKWICTAFVTVYIFVGQVALSARLLSALIKKQEIWSFFMKIRNSFCPVTSRDRGVCQDVLSCGNAGANILKLIQHKLL